MHCHEAKRNRAIRYIKEQIAKKPVEHPVPPPHAREVEK
jgi:hypothetical protein